MRIIERLRERHRRAVDNHEKGALGWWAILQIVWLVWQIVLLMRGGKDGHE